MQVTFYCFTVWESSLFYKQMLTVVEYAAFYFILPCASNHALSLSFLPFTSTEDGQKNS